MSTTTSRVSLYKPAGGENVNVTTDLNNNWDKVDTNLNFRVVASQTARNAISPFWEGLGVRQTDNGKLFVSNGSLPNSGSWTEIVQVNNRTTDELLLGNLVRNQRASASDSAYESRVTGDANARWFVRTDGQMWFGIGSSAADTNLYRNAASELKTDDAFTANGDLTTGGNLVFSANSAEKNTDLSASTTVTNTTTETVVATYTIPANDMVVGATYKVTAWGTASSTGTPTINIKARIGGLGGGQLAQSGAVATASAASNKPWKAEVYLVCVTTGGSGTVFGNLTAVCGFTLGAGVFAGATHTIDGGATVTTDTTASKDLVITVTWGTANASNSIVCRGYTAERVA